ncbi:hypothetical protein BGX23_009379 [Mortierella sp. AD031]|nr:hypothetical protein BGX23_009379 [Mortierella sp. AD031]
MLGTVFKTSPLCRGLQRSNGSQTRTSQETQVTSKTQFKPSYFALFIPTRYHINKPCSIPITKTNRQFLRLHSTFTPIPDSLADNVMEAQIVIFKDFNRFEHSRLHPKNFGIELPHNWPSLCNSCIEISRNQFVYKTKVRVLGDLTTCPADFSHVNDFVAPRRITSASAPALSTVVVPSSPYDTQAVLHEMKLLQVQFRFVLCDS